MKIHKIKLAIIGSGPAGLTAGIYAARAGLDPVVFAGANIGGQLMQSTKVENYPGFAEGIEGPELMQSMIDQAKNSGAKVFYEAIDRVDFKAKPFKLFSNDKEYRAEVVIIATGAVPKRLEIKNEDKFWGKGIHSCATCDGAFYRDKVVAVVGGGSVAFEDAIYLTNHAKKVYLIHRREEFRAEKVLVEKAKKNSKIEFLLNYNVKEILSKESFHSVVLKHNDGSTKNIAIDGLFVAIGYNPVTEIFAGQVDLDDKGYIKKGEEGMTSVEGVFVAGDAEDFQYRQAIVAAADGCKAAMNADRFLISRSRD